MSTLQQILEEAMKLPPEERIRLREALDRLGSNGDSTPAYKANEQERAWIDAHREQYLHHWVALDGDRLLAHGLDAKKVYDEARQQGITSPYLAQVAPKEEAFIGGWQ
jgi:Family of unknown function (DUF5678)